MKRLLRYFILFIMAAVMLYLASCSAVNEMGNKTLSSSEIPRVDINGISEKMIVDGSVNIVVKVSGIGDKDFDRVEFYINDSLYLTKWDYPYLCPWDTMAYSEGPAVINVKAYNNKGDSGNASITVRISRGIYVSELGSDNNSGSGNHPFRNIQPALNKAYNTGKNTIYVSKGSYTNGFGILSNNTHVLGGYSYDFSVQEGYSEIDGSYGLQTGIYANNVTNLFIDRFIINGITGGSIRAIDLNYVNNSILTNIRIINNHTDAALRIFYCYNNLIQAEVSNNQVTAPGTDGVVYLIGGMYNTLSCVISDNNNTWDTGTLSVFSTFNTITGLIRNNYAPYGGGVYIGGFGNVLSAVIINNSAVSGSGIYINGEPSNCIVNCIITNNYSAVGNASIHIYGFNMSGLIISNCIIGGTNGSSGFAIYEDASDAAGHYIMKNTFLTNKMKFLYHDFSGKIISNTSWTNINNTTFTGVAATSGNTVQ